MRLSSNTSFEALVLGLLALALIPQATRAATITKAATGTDLAAGASWGGTAPGSGDVATWASTSLGAGLTLVSNTSWGGIAISGALSNIGITGAGTLTLGASGINMATSTVNLTLGAPITLGASQTWDTASGRTLTASGIISGSSMNLTKAGLGTLTLSGANTYTGATIVNAGTLTLGSGATGSLDSSSTLQMGGGIFNFSRTGTGQAQTVNGLTVSAGNSTVNNTSTGTILTLGAITRTPSIYGTVNFATMTGAIKTTTGNTNTILGPWATTGSTTTLRYAVGSPDGTTSTGIEARTGTTATVTTLANVTDATGNFEYSAAATTVGDLTANTLRYSGAATTTAIGATNTLTLNGLMNAGTSTLTLSGGPSTGGIIIGNTNELVISGGSGAPTTISAVIANGGAPGTLVYNGFFGLPYWNGILTLSGTNLYTGGTVINAGTLSITTASALGSGAVTVNTGGTISLGQYTQPNRDLTLNGGTLKQYTNIFSGPITLAANSNIYADGSNFATSTIGGAISGAGGLTQNGPARAGVTLLTNASNTYTGPTVINNGALIVKSSLYGNDTTKWTPANITVASNAVLGMSVGGASDFTMAQAATMFTNLTTGVNNNGMRANSFMSLDTRNASAGTYTYSAALTDSTGTGGGAVNFEFYGTAATTMALTGANTYSGATMVRNNGTLRVSSLNSVNGGNPPMASSSLGRPTTVANGTIYLGESGWNGNQMPGTTYQSGNLTYTGTGETTDRKLFLGGYGGTKNYTLDQSGTGLLKFTSNIDQQIVNTTQNLILAGSTTGTGEIAGAIANNNTGFTTLVTKNGPGTWTLSGANTYLGATTVTGGALVLANANALNGGIGATGGLSALTFNGGVIGLGVGNFSRPLAAAGTVTGVNFTGNGGWAAYGADRTVNLGGASATITWATANTGLNGQTLILGNATSTHTVDFQNPLDMTNGARTVQVNEGAAFIDGKLSGAITGIAGGNLIKTGLGTLALTATSNYVGTTTVNAGTLLVNGAKTGTGLITVASGAILGGTGSIAGATTFSSGGKAVFTVTPDPVTQANTTPLTIAGVMAFNATQVQLNLPANLPSGTYTLATSSATPTGTVTATPVVVSGSYVAGFTISVVSLDTVGKKLVLTVTVIPANEVCTMLTCNFGTLGLAAIDEAARTVLLSVPPSQPVTALAPTFTLYGNATISPASGSTQNFTNPVVYRVTAENGVNFKDYTVSVPTFTSWAQSGSMFINTTPAGANVTGSVNDFPLLVRFNSSNFNFAQAQSDGRDLRFFTAAGAALPYQIEQWDQAGGKAAVWVKIPTITGNSTQEIIMYWGKSGVASLSNGANVFNSSNGYSSVHHLGDTLADTVGTTTPTNNSTTATNGLIGRSRTFAAGQGIQCGTAITGLPTGAGPFSTGVWIRPSASGKIVVGWGLEQGQGKVIVNLTSPPRIRVDGYFGGADISGTAAIPLSEWTYVVQTFQSNACRLYVNGVLDASTDGGLMNMPTSTRLDIGGWYTNTFVGDMDEVRISNVVRSADWVKLEYENQKSLQSLVGGIVQAGSAFSVLPTSVTMNESTSTTLTAQAGGAQKVYWIYKKGTQETLLATDQLAYNYTAPRTTGNDSAVIQFKAVFAGGTQTIDVPLSVIDTVPDPVFTLVPSTTSWDGRQTMTVTANISNLAAMQAAGFGTLNYKWDVSGVAVIKQTANGTLTLTRSQGSGPLNVSLTIDNGGTPVSQTTVINVQEPASDAWVQRTPDANEKPVSKQFFSRDPGTGLGTIFYRGTQSGATHVYLKIYTTDTGADVLYATHRQALVATAYSFAAPIAAGKVTYKVTYGTTSGGNDSAPLATVTDLVCGDAFIIEGQSNALATDNSAPNDTTTTNKWVRTYGLTSGWGYAISKGNDLQLGLWGWYLANRLVTNNNMPIFIINGAVGGTRIDVHRPNPTNHALPLGTGYGENSYANLYNRVVGAKLTHGIRGLFWHQGEQSQGSGGIDPDYDYKYYQQYFVDISAAWKADFPNLGNYYLFQIWPAACGDTSRNDQLREVQRTLPRLYSNMKIMSTHGIVPGSGCHYVPEGYQVFSDLIGPLVEQDVYGDMPTAKLTAPNLQQAYFTTSAKNEIALVFDQNVAWNPGAPTMLFLANAAGTTSGSVSSGSTTGNTIKLQVSGATSATAITYLKGLVSWLQPNILYGTNGIAALTFADVPIGTQSPYGIWAGGSFANAFTDTAATSDPDGDGQTNQEEFAFGLDPTTGSSVNPITQPLDKATGIFKYTRTKNSGLTYKVYYSTNLSGWTLDAAATQTPATAVAGVETVTVTLAAAAPLDGKLFVRVEATPTP